MVYVVVQVYATLEVPSLVEEEALDVVDDVVVLLKLDATELDDVGSVATDELVD